MRQITLSRFLIEEKHNRNVIAPDRRSPIGVVPRACKAVAIGTGSLGSIHEVERFKRYHDQ